MTERDPETDDPYIANLLERRTPYPGGAKVWVVSTPSTVEDLSRHVAVRPARGRGTPNFSCTCDHGWRDTGEPVGAGCCDIRATWSEPCRRCLGQGVYVSRADAGLPAPIHPLEGFSFPRGYLIMAGRPDIAVDRIEFEVAILSPEPPAKSGT